ncbi:hypothetical protein NFI96_023207, partial [Prochilodus magdalenae]
MRNDVMVYKAEGVVGTVSNPGGVKRPVVSTGR